MLSQNPAIKIGVIGAGLRIRHVLSLLLNEAAGRIQIAAVCDPDPEAIEAMQKMAGSRLRVYQNEKTLCGDPEIEWVFIASPNCYHRRHAVTALDAGKNVFCEKPLATTLEDCLAIRDAVERSGKVFSFGLVLRYSPHYRKIHELLQQGAIGKLVSFEFNETINFNHGGYIFGGWRRDKSIAGSHMLEKCCHDIDIANWLTNSRAIATASFAGLDIFTPDNRDLTRKAGYDANNRRAYQTWMPPGRETDAFREGATIMDNQVTIIEYENGVRATFHANCNAAFHERRLYMCGTEGTLRADVISGIIEVQRIGFDQKRQTFSTKVASDGHGGGDAKMARSLCATIIDGAPPLADVNDGLLACATVFAIDQAQETRSIVDVKPIWDKIEQPVSAR
jgi:Predicted dehydrogenases and related proteins